MYVLPVSGCWSKSSFFLTYWFSSYIPHPLPEDFKIDRKKMYCHVLGLKYSFPCDFNFPYVTWENYLIDWRYGFWERKKIRFPWFYRFPNPFCQLVSEEARRFRNWKPMLLVVEIVSFVSLVHLPLLERIRFVYVSDVYLWNRFAAAFIIFSAKVCRKTQRH